MFKFLHSGMTGTKKLNWWLARVTLVAGLVFLPQNFGMVMITYEGLFPFCKCTWGGASIYRWWGHLTTIYVVINLFVLKGGEDPKT